MFTIVLNKMFYEKKKIFETSFLFRGLSFYGAGCIYTIKSLLWRQIPLYNILFNNLSHSTIFLLTFCSCRRFFSSTFSPSRRFSIRRYVPYGMCSFNVCPLTFFYRRHFFSHGGLSVNSQMIYNLQNVKFCTVLSVLVWKRWKQG